ncbi:MAG: pilin [bacterium]|nr:pilin [bacterium]
MKFLNKNNKKLIKKALPVFLLLVVLIAILPSVAYTAPCPAPEGEICNPISATSINGFIKEVLVGLIKIGIPLIAIAIIYSGFLFVTAQGKPADIEKAKSALLYTLIGSAILLGAWAIAQMISNTVLSL